MRLGNPIGVAGVKLVLKLVRNVGINEADLNILGLVLRPDL